ncbi:MAG: glycosyltransferase family 4 protein [Gammaproteobacteria bacterium]|nr:glycosyltransferase family 4 protein [Gammaproteobacteria bacterium]
MTLVLSAALTALLSLLLTGLATRYARRAGLVDHPGERHSHSETTPRGGGAGLLLALIAAGAAFVPEAFPGFWFSCLLPALVAVAVIGAWDDHRSLSARFRFLVQLAACAWLLGCGVLGGWLPPGPLLPLAFLFCLWMINLYNFMDGSNGMAGLQGVFGGAVLAVLFRHGGDPQAAVLSVLLASACLGFLPWNLGRARVFMGDVGSLSLGLIFSALLVYGVATQAFSLPVSLMVMAVFLGDSTLTLLARVLRGERWYNAHRQHLYQRLIAMGWTHGRVAMLYQIINLLLVVPGIVVAANYPAYAWPAALGLALVLGLGWYVSNKKIGVLAQAG